jgi:hypothetical protein
MTVVGTGDRIMNSIKNKIRKLDNLSDLNELSAFINDCKVMLGRATFRVGDKVYVVQKTKKSLGEITKINMKRCVVNMNDSLYTVPMSMLELRS